MTMEYYSDLRRRIRTGEVRAGRDAPRRPGWGRGSATSSGASQQPATIACVCGGKGFLVKYTGDYGIVPELSTCVCRRKDNLSKLDRSR